ncbi:MAG: secretin N-terminal domain-containing protein, partial [Planctomycetota bacterium]
MLDWFAERADLSLVLESPPPGTLNYRDDRRYTVGEAIDVLNSVLLTKGYTLVRRGRMLLLVNLEDGVPPNLVTDVPLAELDQRGDYELVRVLFRVRNLPAESVAEELESLLGPQGAVNVLGRAGMIQVTETAGRIRTIRSVIEAIEAPMSGQGVTEIQLRNTTTDGVLPILRQMLGVPEGAMSTPTGSLQLGADPAGEKLLVSGAEAQVARVREVLELVDVPARGDLADTPQLEVYPTGQADPELALGVLQTLLSGSDATRLAADSRAGNIIALATPAEHATIRATLDQMQRDARQIEVIPLSAIDPRTAVGAITRLFANPAAEGDAPDPRAPLVDADLATNSLLVRATAMQIEQIKSFLGQLGETGE